MSKHTPGPWRAVFGDSYSTDGVPMDSSIEADGIILAHADGHVSADKANFILMAAAPEMLEALICVRNYLALLHPAAAVFDIFAKSDLDDLIKKAGGE